MVGVAYYALNYCRVDCRFSSFPDLTAQLQQIKTDGQYILISTGKTDLDQIKQAVSVSYRF